MEYPVTEAPAFLEQMIIYEIATKGFTSPKGPESGTFASLAEKIPYLAELGITGIWLSGHQQCDAKHFYNIWTEYACIRPDRLDESLGSPEDFRQMIACAHEYGIRVFLDVITHGVMKDSPLVEEHPDWFQGGSWGMTDFDWYGGHEDLDQWWVSTWVSYVTEYGIDGYRLDVAHYRNDLWALIRKKAREAGRAIAIIAESGPAIRGVTDVIQHGEALSHNWGRNPSSRLYTNVADYCRDRQERREERYDVEICYMDGTVQTTQANAGLSKTRNLQLTGIEYESVPVQEERLGIAYVNQLGILKVEHVYQKKEIQNVKIRDWEGTTWNSNGEGVLEADYQVEYERRKTALYAKFPLRIQDGQYFVIQMSCHDNGWVGFPEGENPYGIQGSRYVAGYASLLAPGIPIFMAGEEFNADYRPIPWHTPGLFGEGEPGEGRWLYGSWLNWEQLEIPEKTAMLEDMKKLITLRKRFSDFIKPCKMGASQRNFCSVDYQSREALPIPYAYEQDGRFLLVAANPWEDREAEVRFELETLLPEGERYHVCVLFGADERKEGLNQEPLTEKLTGKDGELLCGNVTGDPRELSSRSWIIGRDKQPEGGLLVLYLEPMEEKL